MTWHRPDDAVTYRMPLGTWHDSPAARPGESVVIGCDLCQLTLGPVFSLGAARNLARGHARDFHGEIVAAALAREGGKR
jgi:hypothetical protein